MSRKSAIFKILIFGAVFGLLFTVADSFTTKPAVNPPSWVLRSSIAAIFGAFLGLIYHTLTLKDEDHEKKDGEKTREQVPFVSDNSYEITREGGLIYFDYKSLPKSRLTGMLLIFYVILIGGGLRTFDTINPAIK